MIPAAIAAAVAFVLGYAWGHGAGVREHRAMMEAAAEEWRRCWLGDPVKASQAPKE